MTDDILAAANRAIQFGVEVARKGQALAVAIGTAELLGVSHLIDAPDRSVCQYTGELADGLSFPALLPNAAEIAKLTAERDEARQQRDDAVAERDNLVDLTIEVGRLGNYLRHAIADRDEYRDRADEWRDKYDGAQCRMDEMAAEIRELKQAASK